MPLDCREQIKAGFVAALEALEPSVSGLQVDPDRQEDIDDSELPILAVFDDGQQRSDLYFGERGYILLLSVEGIAAGSSKEDAKAAVARLRGLVDNAVLSGLLGGLARDVRIAEEQPLARLAFDANPNACGFVCAYEVEYATKEDDAFTFA